MGQFIGAGTDAQHVFQFFHQGEGILRGPVHLVDKGEDGNIPHPADLEQLDGLFLHALGRVDQHDRRVGGDQHAVGVLTEILVAGGVQNVDAEAVVFELHGAGGHADAALLFDVHPVAGGVALGLARLHAAGLTDRPAVEQQLFGQGGFTCVRVADNGEGAPFQDLLHCFGSQCFGSHEGLFPLFLA